MLRRRPLIRAWAQRAAAAGLLLAAAGAGAAAAGYDSFANGMDDIERDDAASAVTAFTAAIAAPDLSPALLPLAYRGRALAQSRLEKCPEALADADASLKLNPDDVNTIQLRVGALACTGDYAGALSGYAVLLSKRPAAWLYRERAFIYWRKQDFAGGIPDLTAAIKLDTQDPYYPLWLEVLRVRAGSWDAATAATEFAGQDMSRWPGPLLALYAGKGTPEDADAAAARADADAADGEKCEANFYIAEWELGHQDMAGVRERLQSAADSCPRDFIERDLARTELKRVK